MEPRPLQRGGLRPPTAEGRTWRRAGPRASARALPMPLRTPARPAGRVDALAVGGRRSREAQRIDATGASSSIYFASPNCLRLSFM